MNKMYTIFVLIFLYAIILGCTNSTSKEITISGSVSKALANIDGKKIYLYDLAQKDVVKDSTIVRNYNFSFTIQYDSNFTPFHAKLAFQDTTRDPALLKSNGKQGYIAYLRSFGIVNPYDSTIVESSFYVDEGQTVLNPVSSRSIFLSIKGGKQNIPFYKHIILRSLPDSSDSKRKSTMEYNKKTIQQYSYSYELLNQLYKIKNQMTDDELNGLCDVFDKDLNAHSRFKAFIASKKTSVYNNYNLIVLEDNKGARSSLLSNSKFKLLVFWASWCGPCRAEIPALKKLFQSYGDHGLSIVSVSIDNNKANWNLALNQEKMPWKQLIVPESEKVRIDAIFDIKSIPLMFLIDTQNKIIERIVGMDGDTYQRMNEKIGMYLKN